MWKPLLMIVAGVLCGCNRSPPAAQDADGALTHPVVSLDPTDEELVADAVLRFVLTADELHSEREFYGTPSDKQIVLLNGRHVSWPDREYLSLASYTVHRPWHRGLTGPDCNRLLGVRLDKLELAHTPTPGAMFDAGIEVSVENAGGHKNGRVGGGCTVFLATRKMTDGWVVEFAGAVGH